MWRDLLRDLREDVAWAASWFFRNVLIYFADAAACYAIWHDPSRAAEDPCTDDGLRTSSGPGAAHPPVADVPVRELGNDAEGSS